ncbi:DUF4407 domain-containing protein [Actinoplanes sp. NPDC051494]|uniref:DUF4407 domain-containing protein n=1 Tax=Actinoplanes sp. NPDC051494 TaxID=3363907 RepID=UPI00379FBD34
MGLTHHLALVAGARPDVLEAAPGDRIRYAAMGGVIISTAAVAAASAIMAVRMAMGLPIAWALLIGLVWGVIIFNLDRLLVVQMMRQPRKLMSLAAAVPRVLLALVLGTVISTPVVLEIFRPEIETQLLVLQAEQNEEYLKQISGNPDYARIPGLTEQVAADQAVLDKGAPVNVESDPAVVSARTLYDNAQKDYATAEKAVVCEKEGTCGSGKAGAGIAFDEKVRIRDDRLEIRDEAADRLASAREQATTNLAAAQRTAITAARTRLAANQETLAGLNQRLEAEKRAHAARSGKDDGLLARLEALDRLAADRPTLQLAHLTLFLLFLALELLPVLMKLLQVLGPETAYDRSAKEVDAGHARRAAGRRDAEREIEDERLELIKAAAKAGNQKVVDAQSQVMGRVLDAWEQHALEESERDVDRWRARPPVPDDDDLTRPQPALYEPAPRTNGRAYWPALDDFDDPGIPPQRTAGW